MSYILDALKKSEQERGKGDIPNVQTVHSSSLNYNSNNRNSYWPYILIAAVVLNFLAISYFIFSKERSLSTNKPPPAEKITNETPDNFIQQVVEADQEREPVRSTKTAPANRSANTRPAAKPVEKPIQKQQGSNSRTISDYYDLPESIKNRLPAITVSAHVYSKNPLQRSIVINNNFMEEGEYISKELLLHEITRDGAIFDFKGDLISYSVVSQWQ